ncbi:helix-turn-helix domain-containing protein [Acidaminococcus intestini]|uniref:helix-turn-helix domain-containing protein n=2 Tax=Acidaminococcaceae TaxID=909930 RepID=UPI002110ADB5|nr:MULTISPECIES: helix-turn-helix domain-containing protein [Acidaminococcus]
MEERSEYPDVSTVTNRSWICSKKDIPAVRVGSQWRFKIEDVDEWTQSGRSNFSARTKACAHIPPSTGSEDFL